MRFDQMTIKLQEAFSTAQALCSSENQQALECEHLLLSLFQDPDGIATALVKKVGVDPDQIQGALQDRVAKFPKVSNAGQVHLSETLNDVARKAEEEAQKMKDEFLSAEHILLAVANHKKANIENANIKLVLSFNAKITGSSSINPLLANNHIRLIQKSSTGNANHSISGTS